MRGAGFALLIRYRVRVPLLARHEATLKRPARNASGYAGLSGQRSVRRPQRAGAQGGTRYCTPRPVPAKDGTSPHSDICGPCLPAFLPSCAPRPKAAEAAFSPHSDICGTPAPLPFLPLARHRLRPAPPRTLTSRALLPARLVATTGLESGNY